MRNQIRINKESIRNQCGSGTNFLTTTPAPPSCARNSNTTQAATSSVEVLTWLGLVTYYVLFFIAVGTRRVYLGGITRQPDAGWMEQVARNATMQDNGYLNGCRYLLHDRDQKFCHEFRETRQVA